MGDGGTERDEWMRVQKENGAMQEAEDKQSRGRPEEDKEVCSLPKDWPV